MAYMMHDDERYTSNGLGYLYNHAAAQQICPDGWHLPTVNDWRTLTDYVEREFTGMYNDDTITVAKALASESNSWYSCDTVPGAPGYHRATNNTSGFGLLPAGSYHTPEGTDNNPDFHNYGWSAYLWTSTPTPYSNAGAYMFALYCDEISHFTEGATIFQAFSVRCVKDN